MEGLIYWTQFLPSGFAVTKGTLEFAGEDLVAMASERRRNLLGRDIAFIGASPAWGGGSHPPIGRRQRYENVGEIGMRLNRKGLHQ